MAGRYRYRGHSPIKVVKSGHKGGLIEDINAVIREVNVRFNSINEVLSTLTTDVEALTAGVSLVFAAETDSAAAGTVISSGQNIPLDTILINTLDATLSATGQEITIPTAGLYAVNYTVFTDSPSASDALFLAVWEDGTITSQYTALHVPNGYFGNRTLNLPAGAVLTITADSAVTLSSTQPVVVVISITQIG